MKKLIGILILSVIVVCSSLAFAACDGGSVTPPHTHEYQIKNDDDKHWQECSCGEKKDEEEHSFVDGVCSCGKEEVITPEGNPGTGEEPEETPGGEEPGDNETPEHTHEYTTLKYDTNKHWYECSCGAKKDEAVHSGGSATCTAKAKCSVCNTEYGEYSHSYNKLEKDVSKHWYECSCGAKNGETNHSFTNNVCSICEQNRISIGLTYKLINNNTEYEVSGIGTCIDTDIIIPSTYNDKPVTSIGYRAFYNCDSLTSITIPNSVTSIGRDAFEDCDSLTSISVDENNQNYKSIDGNLYTKDGKTLLQYAIGKTATDFVIPNSVTSIGAYAFQNCDSLTSITIPNSVTSIGDYAFEVCDSLTSVTIPNSVTSIGYRAFLGCDLLTIYCEAESKPSGWSSDWNPYRPVVWDCNNNDVATDGYIYTIVDGVRYGIKDGVATVVKQSSNITTANIPSSIPYKGNTYSVTSIGFGAFLGCDSLTSITIPNSVTSIGYEAFYGCNSLTIYCEATSKPSGWISNWNSSNCPVVWGYMG